MRFPFPKENPLDTLGLGLGYSDKDLKLAYLKLCKTYHPDMPMGSETKFKQVQEAYRCLTSPIQKYEILSSLRKGTTYAEFYARHLHPSVHNKTSHSSSHGTQHPFQSTQNQYQYQENHPFGPPVDPKTMRSRNLLVLGGLFVITIGLNLWSSIYFKSRVFKQNNKNKEDGPIFTQQDLKDMRDKHRQNGRHN